MLTNVFWFERKEFVNTGQPVRTFGGFLGRKVIALVFYTLQPEIDRNLKVRIETKIVHINI